MPYFLDWTISHGERMQCIKNLEIVLVVSLYTHLLACTWEGDLVWARKDCAVVTNDDSGYIEIK